MSKMQHAACVALLMAGAGGLLGWLAGHTDILFADGLRYIDQARADRPRRLGRRPDPIRRPPDLPDGDRGGASPRRPATGPRRGRRRPSSPSVVAGILLVVPLYLVALELFGASTAWLACLLVYLVPAHRPRHGRHAEREHVPALLDLGRLGGAPVPPRGELRLAAPDDRLRGAGLPEPPRGAAAPRGAGGDAPADAPAALDPAELAALVGRDGLPGARARCCSSAPTWRSRGGSGPSRRSPGCSGRRRSRRPLAVERERPLDPDQSTAKTYVLAVRAMAQAVRDRRDAAAPAARRGGPDLDLAARPAGPALALHGDRHGGRGPGPGPAARDGGLLQPEARDGHRPAADRGGRRRA